MSVFRTLCEETQCPGEAGTSRAAWKRFRQQRHLERWAFCRLCGVCQVPMFVACLAYWNGLGWCSCLWTICDPDKTHGLPYWTLVVSILWLSILRVPYHLYFGLSFGSLSGCRHVCCVSPRKVLSYKNSQVNPWDDRIEEYVSIIILSSNNVLRVSVSAKVTLWVLTFGEQKGICKLFHLSFQVFSDLESALTLLIHQVSS